MTPLPSTTSEVSDWSLTPEAATSRASRDLAELARVMSGGGVVVLSGAGLSTESGIPDYRGPTGAVRRHQPMTYQAFVNDPVARRRYWARSHVGWRQFAGACPNDGHRAVADFERLGIVSGTITQNVDGLHQAAGSQAVIDLHGRLDRVVCLDCRATSTRSALNARLAEANSLVASDRDAAEPGRRRRRAGRAARRLRHGRLRGLRRRAQAGRRLLR